jgi:HAD superfamily hydrolase (TIGR01509 family)
MQRNSEEFRKRMMQKPKFIYFDLGNVILNFSHERGCVQMAEVAGVSVEDVRRFAFDSAMTVEYECGRITTREFYNYFCEQTGTSPEFKKLVAAGSDIFSLNTPILAILTQLKLRGYRIGILSNTCDMHWQWASQGRYRVIAEYFDVMALSFEIGSVKPDREIYLAAAKLAGIAPSEIFYTDDIAGHIKGARSAGFDAQQFTSARQLVADLNQRGIGLTV